MHGDVGILELQPGHSGKHTEEKKNHTGKGKKGPFRYGATML